MIIKKVKTVLGRFNTVVYLPAADACYHNVCAMNFKSSCRKPKKFDSTPHPPRKRRHTRFVPNDCLSRYYEEVWKLRNSPPWMIWKVVTEVGWDGGMLLHRIAWTIGSSYKDNGHMCQLCFISVNVYIMYDFKCIWWIPLLFNKRHGSQSTRE